jgi:PAS domain S-box-containing protein
MSNEEPKEQTSTGLDALRQRAAELEAARADLEWIEEERRQSRELNQLILSHITDAVLITDGSGNFTYISPSARSVFGYSVKEIRELGKVSRLLGDIPFDAESLDTLREIHNIEHEITDKDGRRRVLLIDVRSVAIRNGRMLFTCRDITKRKRAQESLREHRDRLEDLVEDRTAELRASNEQLAQRNDLLSALSRVQTRFISEDDPRVLFDQLLSDLLSLTDSEYGFIGQVIRNEDDEPALKVHAVSNIIWKGDSPGTFERDDSEGFDFGNVRSLVRAVMTSGKQVTAHEPGGAQGPDERPSLRAFLGLPLQSGRELIGIVGIANRPRGYDAELIELLQPFIVTCSNIMEAYRNVQQRQQAEAELAKSEKNFRNSIDSSPLGTSIVTKQGRLLYANQAFLDIYGYDSVEDLKKVPLKKRYAPQSYAQHLERRAHMRRGETAPAYYDLSIVRRDGDVRDLWVFWDEVLWDGQHQYQVIYQDITERKRAEAAIRESEERYRQLFERSSDAIFLVDAATGRYLDGNEAAEHLTGRSVAELRTLTTADVQPLGILQRLQEMDVVEDALDPGEVTFVRPDGSQRTALLSAARLSDRLFFGIARDITERQQSQRDLEERQSSLTNAQRIAHLGNWDWDVKNNSFRLSEEASRILDTAPGEAGEPYDVLSRNVHPDDREFVRRSVLQALFEEKPFNYEYRILRPDASQRVVHVRGDVSYDEQGAPLSASGTIQDLTEQRALEQKVAEFQELNQVKTNLLSTVSHELRTPLAIIKGYSTLLLDYDQRLDNEEKRDYIRSIDRATSRLTELVDHILDMSRLESGLLELERTSTTISRLVKEAVDEAQLRAPNREITLSAGDNLPRVNIDAKRIRQVLDNLLDNAIKYSAEETEIVVSLDRRDEDVLVKVTDRGVGIAAKDLDKVFDRMYRAEQNGTPSSGGVGLGLAISRGMVEAHGGRIWAESEEGKGTTFSFTLPI